MFDNIPVDKIGLKDTRLSNLEYLGGDLIEAGNEFGPGTPYGKSERQCCRLLQSETEFYNLIWCCIKNACQAQKCCMPGREQITKEKKELQIILSQILVFGCKNMPVCNTD